MADSLKEIAAYSEDAISMEMKNLEREDQQLLNKLLLSVKNGLRQKCSPKKKKDSARKSKLSKEDLFNRLIAGIEDKVTLYEQRLINGNEKLQVEFNFSINFEDMSIDQKIETHRRLKQFHNNCEMLANVSSMLLGKINFI
ncbi:hypothetical protein [Methanosarcina sp.]|uniref:hypothetical protein n=1 Tax=Methanosarcina sp. TaxID=2213 RepID=UPI003BB58250